MINTLDMYKIAENEKIDILDYKWTNTKARIFEINNSYYIGGCYYCNIMLWIF